MYEKFVILHAKYVGSKGVVAKFPVFLSSTLVGESSALHAGFLSLRKVRRLLSQ
jgi:hypothetical protein